MNDWTFTLGFGMKEKQISIRLRFSLRKNSVVAMHFDYYAKKHDIRIENFAKVNFFPLPTICLPRKSLKMFFDSGNLQFSGCFVRNVQEHS